MNDTEATLLSHAYENPSTRMSVIWGTGFNAALLLPRTALSDEKLGRRPREWMEAAEAVVINTEASMFGEGVFPVTSADEELDALSEHPGFQPLEQLTSGRYLGEICRLCLIRGAESGALFDGVVPGQLRVRFGLETALMREVEK